MSDSGLSTISERTEYSSICPSSVDLDFPISAQPSRNLNDVSEPEYYDSDETLYSMAEPDPDDYLENYDHHFPADGPPTIICDVPLPDKYKLNMNRSQIFARTLGWVYDSDDDSDREVEEYMASNRKVPHQRMCTCSERDDDVSGFAREMLLLEVDKNCPSTGFEGERERAAAELHPIEVVLLRRKAEQLTRQRRNQLDVLFETFSDLLWDAVVLFVYVITALAFTCFVTSVALALTFDTRTIHNFLENWGFEFILIWFDESYSTFHGKMVSLLTFNCENKWIPIVQTKAPPPPNAWYAEAVDTAVGLWNYVYGRGQSKSK